MIHEIPQTSAGNRLTQRTRATLWFLLTAGAMYAQSPNLTGGWRTNAGFPYTIIENRDSGISIIPGTPSKPSGYGWLQRKANERSLEGELVLNGCWLQLSLEESDEGSALLGSARINVKKSNRGCRSLLTKEAKKGEPFQFGLTR